MSLVEETFGISLKVLHFFGFYPYLNNGILYKVRSFIQHFLLITTFSILGSMFFITERHNIDFEQMADTAYMLAQISCAVPKFLPFIFNSHKISICLYYIEKPIFKPRNEKQEMIIKEFQKLYRLTYNPYKYLAILGVSSWATRPFFFPQIKLPADWWLPFDPKSDWKIFWSIYMHQAMCVGFVVFTSVMTDTLIAGLACFGAAQFQILRDNLENLSVYADEDINNTESIIASQSNRDKLKSKKIYEKICESVVHHNEIIRFIKLYEETFSLVVFSQFSGSIVVICITCLELSIVEPFSFIFFAIIDYVIGFLLQIFLFCYHGTHLYNEGEAVLDAAYMADWYNFDIKCRKALIILMESTKSLKYVTAGKILEISLVTFTSMIKGSYSLLTFLQTYQ